MNSVEIKKNFEQKVDKAYTGYYDNTKLNRLFKDTLYRVVNEKLDNYGIQKNREEISFLIKTGVVKSINNNKICTAEVPVSSVTIVNPSVFQVTFDNPHNIVSGDSVTISGVQGTLTITQANGTFTPTIVDDFSIEITVAFATGVHTPNTGEMTFSKLLNDYYRLLTTKARVKENDELTIIGASNYSPIKVKVDEYNNLRSGEKITISGVSGNTNANGDFYIRKVNSKEFELFTDAILKVPVSGNANYTSGGIAVRSNYEYCKELVSDKKIAVYSWADAQTPLYETSDKYLKFYPNENTIDQITIDYCRKPFEIDFKETAVDYTNFYNTKFLFYLIDQAAKTFGFEIRDNELYNGMIRETAENK
jgi:hypothetical protein